MIPRRFFWMLDFAVVAFAFCLAYALWPPLHQWTAHLNFDWLPPALRPESATGELPPFHSVIRILVLGGMAAILALEVGEGYSPLLQQSRRKAQWPLP